MTKSTKKARALAGILDRAYFPARVERVPQDVNQLGWQNLGQSRSPSRRNHVAITSQSRRFLVGISSLQQRSGGVGEVRSKSKAKAKAEAKAEAKA